MEAEHLLAVGERNEAETCRKLARLILQPDKALHSHIWKTVTNPGAIVYCGEIIGIWTGKKRSRGLEINMTLWKDIPGRDKLGQLAERYAAFRQQKLLNIGMSDL